MFGGFFKSDFIECLKIVETQKKGCDCVKFQFQLLTMFANHVIEHAKKITR